MYVPPTHDGTLNLQGTIAAATYATNGPAVLPHFPLSCTSTLALDEDGTLRCEHAATNDERVRQAITHSIAILLMEAAFAKFGGPVSEPAK